MMNQIHLFYFDDIIYVYDHLYDAFCVYDDFHD